MPEISTAPSPASESSVFRMIQAMPDSTPVGSVRVEKPVDRLDATDSPIQPSFLEHQEMSQTPYTAKLFNVDGIFENLSSVDKGNILFVEQYLQNRIEKGELDGTFESLSAVMQELEEKAGVEKGTTPYFRLEKVVDLLKVVPDSIASLPSPEVQKAKEVVKEKKKEVAQLSNKLAEKESALVETNQTLTSLQKKLETTTTKANRLLEENRLLTLSKSEIPALEEKASQLATQVESFKTLAEKRSSEVNALTRTVEVSKNKIESLSDQLNSLTRLRTQELRSFKEETSRIRETALLDAKRQRDLAITKLLKSLV